ncbi:MAG: hypothetical protein KGH71_02610 [Candidatus Micrarchaeota archaeon]|nr:hypothetical protein [Candidatus Micrarchaeota archaeon]
MNSTNTKFNAKSNAISFLEEQDFRKSPKLLTALQRDVMDQRSNKVLNILADEVRTWGNPRLAIKRFLDTGIIKALAPYPKALVSGASNIIANYSEEEIIPSSSLKRISKFYMQPQTLSRINEISGAINNHTVTLENLGEIYTLGAIHKKEKSTHIELAFSGAFAKVLRKDNGDLKDFIIEQIAG